MRAAVAKPGAACLWWHSELLAMQQGCNGPPVCVSCLVPTSAAGACGSRPAGLQQPCFLPQAPWNPQVRDAMKHIWMALCPDTRAALTAHFAPILASLLKELGGGQWRVREAAAAATAELLQASRCRPSTGGSVTAVFTLSLTACGTPSLSVRLLARRDAAGPRWGLSSPSSGRWRCARWTT